MMRRLLPPLLALAACGDKQRDAPAGSQSRLTPVPKVAVAANVPVTGIVLDRDTREPVSAAEVVFRGEHGDITTSTEEDGTWALHVARGTYRTFVRDPRVISTGMQGRLRLRAAPTAELAGAADEKLMPLLEVDGATTDVELTVTAGVIVRGLVTDTSGRPVPNAVIGAVALESPVARGTTPNVTAPVVRRNAPRPVLGTDVAITDNSGFYALRLPVGRYELVANHPDYAGAGGIAEIEAASSSLDAHLTLVRGCVIAGKVATASGRPPHDGAIETQSDAQMAAGFPFFGPSGRVTPDGTFRWTTTDSGSVRIRAWPWRQPASEAKQFDCSDGARHDNVVLRLPTAVPDIAGTISDAHGNPVPLAFVDIAPLEPGERGQQERADASGSWDVFDMRAGRYQITASAAGRGIAAETITAPRRDIALRLSGVGRIAGTTTELVDGSFELTFHHCGNAADPIEVDDDARIVVVRGGRFTVERVPACTLTMTVRWRDTLLTPTLVVDPDRTAYLELALGAPRGKTVRGIVRDDTGKPVANARITALLDNQEATTVRTDSDGRYELTTRSGAAIVAGNGVRSGRSVVGRANVDVEHVDITLDLADDESQ